MAADDPSAQPADRDYQLRSALNLLKGLHILNRKAPDAGKESNE